MSEDAPAATWRNPLPYSGVWWEKAPNEPPYRLWWSNTDGLHIGWFKNTHSLKICRLQNWALKVVDELPPDAGELALATEDHGG